MRCVRPVAGWTTLALVLAAWPPGASMAAERMVVVSRHSGEVLAGTDFPIHALEAEGARALAAAVRIEV
ncbi:MAG TPA: hypothetical protein VLT82_01930, partial [Myxococcaceae bacterium]|nr:hypothetical protein [Myxococcaceae bacterium]